MVSPVTTKLAAAVLVVLCLSSALPGYVRQTHAAIPADAQVVPAAAATPLPAPPAEEFFRGEVIEIIEEQKLGTSIGGTQAVTQQVRVSVTTGPDAGQEITLEYNYVNPELRLEAGEGVVLLSPNDQTYVFDKYRLPALGSILAIFIILAVIFAGWRGLTSLVGLGVSILVLVSFVVPRIMAGDNPLLISLIAGAVIGLVSIYLAHGFNRRTTVAVISTAITITVAVGLAQLFVRLAGLTGLGSEEAFYLQSSPVGFINLKGLLLGGIIIGALGVLDDITTSQAAAVEEIWRANPALTRRELFRRGASVGREHITSLINTLALAYAGASFPALLLFTVYQRPWWVVINTETIAEEVIRTLVGSTALMFAVPITTLLAAWTYTRLPARGTQAGLPARTATDQVSSSGPHQH